MEEEAEISETWRVDGLPSFYKTAHLRRILEDLHIEFVDVFKKTPSYKGFVRFPTIEEKLRAKELLENHTIKSGAKIIQLKCKEVKNRQGSNKNVKWHEKNQKHKNKNKNNENNNNDYTNKSMEIDNQSDDNKSQNKNNKESEVLFLGSFIFPFCLVFF